jgi:hypothetical protein
MSNLCNETGVPVNDWYDLYRGNAKYPRLFTDESIKHPAKMAPALLVRILDHLEQELGWLKPGDCLLDNMAGRGSTALFWCERDPANKAVTIELEPEFIRIEQECRSHAADNLGYFPQWTIIQGDARNTHGLIADFNRPAVEVGSPPYASGERQMLTAHLKGSVGDAFKKGERPISWENMKEEGRFHYGVTPGQIGDLPDQNPEIEVSSPPYSGMEIRQPSGSVGEAYKNGQRARDNFVDVGGDIRHYGKTPCQIGSLPDVTVSSPPYGEGVINGTSQKQAEKLRALTQDPNSSLYGRDPNGQWFQAMETGYGQSEGNINNLKSDDFPEVAVQSPPYEGSLGSDDPDKRGGLFRDPKRRNDRTLTSTYSPEVAVQSPPYGSNTANVERPSKHTQEYKDKYGALGICQNEVHTYGNSEGQIGAMKDGPEIAVPEIAVPEIAVPEINVGSQPYEAQSGGHNPSGGHINAGLVARQAAGRRGKKAGYGDNGAGQIGQMEKETYASAMAAVYSSMALAGVQAAVLVTKNPTKGGKLRRLDLLTISLMEQAGYRLHSRKRAWVWETVDQMQARGGDHPRPVQPKSKLDQEYWEKWGERPTGRLSFFKLLHLRKGIPAAQWEDVLVLVLKGGKYDTHEREGCGLDSPTG